MCNEKRKIILEKNIMQRDYTTLADNKNDVSYTLTRHKVHGVSKLPDKMPVFVNRPFVYVDGVIYNFVPFFTNIAISKDGVLVDCVARKIINRGYELTKSGYYNIRVKLLTGDYYNIGVHKLVALAWCENDDYVINNIVDHIDDDKTNYHADNLRWVSSTLNVTKTIVSSRGLFLIRDIDTGVTSTAMSSSEASEIIGRSKIDTQRAPMYFGKVWSGSNGRFELYRERSFTGWAYERDDTRSFSLVLEKNGELFKYKTFKQFFDSQNSKKSTIEKFCRNNGYKILHIKKRKIVLKHVQVRDVINNVIYTVKSISDASNITGVPKSTLTLYLRRCDNYLLTDRWLVRKFTVAKWREPSNKTPINKPKVIMVKDKDDVIVEEFTSINSLRKFFNKDYRTIYSYIDKKTKITFKEKENCSLHFK